VKSKRGFAPLFKFLPLLLDKGKGIKGMGLPYLVILDAQMALKWA